MTFVFVVPLALAQRARITRTSGHVPDHWFRDTWAMIINEIFVNGSGRRHDKSASENFQLDVMSNNGASRVDSTTSLLAESAASRETRLTRTKQLIMNPRLILSVIA